MQLAPLPVVLPLLMAAFLAGAGPYLYRWLIDLLSCVTSACVLVACILLARQSMSAPIVYWFGGWQPGPGHPPLGISFVIDPIGAGLAAFVALLVLASLIFSWEYFEAVESLFHAAMLVFLGAMCGLALTGDLFNLFVWFELMSAAGVMLCGYHSNEPGPLQGALNFAVMNTLGAFLSLMGVALLYGRTGALNFAQIAVTLREHPPESIFLATAFLFLSAGFLVKAAAFPFHFWLDDAHAVAPTPVCVLFSGVMVELGLYAVARLYWTIFAVPLHAGDAVRALLLIMGTLTAVIGAVTCFGQRHLKRLLAFSTISHMGLMILGVGLLVPQGLAGASWYVLGHGMVKGSLFIVAGILLHHFGTTDEYELRGRGRHLPGIGIIMAVGALGLAGLPPFANSRGEQWMHHAGESLHLSWLPYVFGVAEVFTAAAVLRVTGRVFLGWGKRDPATEDAPHIPMKRETKSRFRHTPITMWLPAVVLLIIAFGIALPESTRTALAAGAPRLQDPVGYASAVLQGKPGVPPPPASSETEEIEWTHPAIVIVLAIILGLLALFPDALGLGENKIAGNAVRLAMRPFRLLHTGRVGDYVAWFVFGIAGYSAFLILSSR